MASAIKKNKNQTANGKRRRVQLWYLPYGVLACSFGRSELAVFQMIYEPLAWQLINSFPSLMKVSDSSCCSHTQHILDTQTIKQTN